MTKWEKGLGHKWTGEKAERNGKAAADDLKCGVCSKKCKSKGGLVIHRRRMHEVSGRRKEFKCEECEKCFKQEANLLNHKKVCGGAVASSKDKKKCRCGKEYSKSYFAKHRRTCPAALEVVTEVAPRAPQIFKGVKCTCKCGRELLKTNLARHKREACPLGDAGS